MKDPMDSSNYDRQQGFFRTVDGAPVRKIYVSNLPIEATNDYLRSIFKQFGTVVQTQICLRQEDRPNRFGFVTFDSPRAAANILRKKSIRYEGRKIYVSAADGWHQPVELPCGKIIWDTRPKMRQFDPNRAGGSGELTATENETCDENEVNKVQEEPNMEEEEEGELCSGQCDDDSPISKLNDDCLLSVFEYLNVQDRFITGLVCKRWRRITSYYWHSIKHLDFTAPPFNKILMTEKVIALILGLCPNVRRINIDRDRSAITSNIIITIADLCPQLEEIRMRDNQLKDRTLVYLARKCPNLKSFSMNASSRNHDQEMRSFVKNLKQLSKIHLKYSRSSSSGTWLKFLSSPLKSLKLEMYDFEPRDLIEGLKKNDGCLEELSFVACSSLGNQDLDTILSLSPNITSLQVSGSYMFLTPSSLMPVARLKNLTHLDFDNNRVVSDTLIRELVDGCPKLTHLNLSGIDNDIFTNSGLSLVVKFHELTSLRLASLTLVTDALLKLIAKHLKGLKQLDLMDCTSVTDEGCIEILTHCSWLDTLDITSCDQVTNETVNTAIKLANNNIHKPRLHIIAGGTGIEDDYCLIEPHKTRRVLVDLDCKFIPRLTGDDDYPDDIPWINDYLSYSSFDTELDSDSCDDDYFFAYDEEDDEGDEVDLIEPVRSRNLHNIHDIVGWWIDFDQHVREEI